MFSAKTVLDVRGGLNYYHNVTSTQGDGLTTSKDVGIPGANLDEFTSGLSQISIGGYADPVLGFSASQPWDRSEKTWNFDGDDDAAVDTHTVKIGGEFRHNRDLLLQTQDAGGPRGRFAFNSSGTGNPAERAVDDQRRQRLRLVPARLAEHRPARSEGLRRAGTKHIGRRSLFIQDKWQARSNITVDLGLRWEYYTPLAGPRGQGHLSNYDPATHTLRVAGLRRPRTTR